MTIRVGTSGWHYLHWVGPFYPPGLPPARMLTYYAEEFDAVEVDYSFYRLPTPEILAAWRESTPEGFSFAFKASRYLTHMKKLKDAGPVLTHMLERTHVLRDKLGPVLFQLPPRWHADQRRLTDFLRQLPRGIRAAFEFRDPSWFTSETYEALRAYGAALCVYDLQGKQWPPAAAPIGAADAPVNAPPTDAARADAAPADASRSTITADFVYLRLHGPGEAYQGSYDQEALEQWAKTITAWHDAGKDVYCFFNNDPGGYAVQNARELKRLLATPPR